MVIALSVLDGPRFLRHLHPDRQPLPGDRIPCTREQSRAASDRGNDGRDLADGHRPPAHSRFDDRQAEIAHGVPCRGHAGLAIRSILMNLNP